MQASLESSRTLNYQGARIAYSMHGRSETEPLLLLHPAFADRQMFQDQVDFFAKTRRVIAIDMPGHGQTQVQGSRVAMKDMPAIVEALLDQHDIAACHLVGVSMGSLVAQAFAYHHPARVRSLCIVGGYSIHKENKQVLQAQQKEMTRWMLRVVIGFQRFKGQVARQCCSTPHAQELFARGIAAFRRRSFLAMEGMQQFFVPDARPLPYPLLLVYGSEDLPVIQDAMQALHRAEPASQLVELAGAGHCANADSPEAFNRELERFVSEYEQ
ncbi:alpha/beta fold hydrolase [Paenibacillus daejeonensis]|uniref:alpha/beta fold hydrolase n=1 Tax=Paenibacillus daejeonensis TaxID=135193 RepID=UPI000360A653|nr:alpha/beta fold hydrolase [Paenibacillus daejeonensis]